MTPGTNPDELPRAAGESQRLEFRIEALERCIADLQRVVAERADLYGWADGPLPSAVPELSPRETGESPLTLRLEKLAAFASATRNGARRRSRLWSRGTRKPSAAVPRTEGDR